MRTPGKWEVEQNKFGDYLIIATEGLKHSAVADTPKNNDNAEANAQYICKAVNSHEDLVIALKVACCYPHESGAENWEITRHFLKEVLAALKENDDNLKKEVQRRPQES